MKDSSISGTGVTAPKAGGRNSEVELLRFLLAALVMLYHGNDLINAGGGVKIIRCGHLAVDVFFMLSGYLMMRSIARQEDGGTVMSTPRFLMHKVKAFFPELVIATLVACGVLICADGATAGSCICCLNSVFKDISLLKMCNLVSPTAGIVNGPTWYLSSMVLAMGLLYPLLKRCGVTALLVGAALCILGCIIVETGTLASPYEWMGFTYKGNLRAFADLALGAAAYPAAQAMLRHKFPPVYKGLMACAKYTLLTFAFACICLTGKYSGAFLIAAWLYLVLAFGGNTLDCALFRNKLVLFLGRFSLPLYLSHRVYSMHMGEILPGGQPPVAVWSVYICLGAATALFVMFAARLTRRLTAKPLYKLDSRGESK